MSTAVHHASMYAHGGGGGGGGGGTTLSVTSLEPPSVPASAGVTTVTIHGVGFEAGSVVELDQQAQTTTFVSATELTITADPSTPAMLEVTVRNPDDEESNSVPFVVAPELPDAPVAAVLTSVTPTTVVAGVLSALELVGTDFDGVIAAGAADGSTWACTINSPTSITVSSALYTVAGESTIKVIKNDPRGGQILSNELPVTVTAAAGDADPEANQTSGTGNPPTEVVPGDPGEFLPKGSAVPENIGALRGLELEMESLKKWKKGEHIVIGTGNVHWDGEDWAKGIA